MSRNRVGLEEVLFIFLLLMVVCFFIFLLTAIVVSTHGMALFALVPIVSVYFFLTRTQAGENLVVRILH